jgi:Na+-transporting NADH:ubiquinone oxidoreductase subunit NqrD
MGFWYMLLFVIGIVLIVIGSIRKDVPRSVKIVILLFIIGILFVVVSLILLLPGSSYILDELLRIQR